MVENLCKGYLYRLNKCIELKGGRIEPEHLVKKTQEKYNWKKPDALPAVRIIYNDAKLKIHHQRELRKLKQEIKEIESLYSKKIRENRSVKKKYKKRDLKFMSIGRALSIVEGPKRLKTEKEKKVGEIKKKIEKISKMTLKEYIEHRNGKENENEIEIENWDEEETNVSEIEKKFFNWKKFAKK